MCKFEDLVFILCFRIYTIYLLFQTKICEGGLVPKSFYMSVEEYEKEKAEGHHLFDDSMYHVISLAKGQVHEVSHS